MGRYLAGVFGPVMLAKAELGPAGTWDAARTDLVELWDSFNQSSDGQLAAPLEYLSTIARRTS